MQALQPMHASLSKSTIPSDRRYMAEVGQARYARRVLALVAPGYLERTAGAREVARIDVLDVGACNPQRNFVLRLACGGAGMTADAPGVVDDLGPARRPARRLLVRARLARSFDRRGGGGIHVSVDQGPEG